MNQNIPAGDGPFAQWGDNFALQAETNALVLGLSPTEIGEIELANTNYDAAYGSVLSTLAAYRAATETKREVRAATEATYRKYAKQFLANPALSNALLTTMGFSVTPAPAGPVTAPTDVAVSGFSNGNNNLTWKRAGNIAGTVFLIEAQIGSSSTWVQVGATSKVRFTHSGQTPGVQVVYRVRAQRAGSTSAPSNTAIVYGSSPSNEIFLQQAA